MESTLSLTWMILMTCALPAIAIWFSMRSKMNETNKRTEIIMAALEKNPDIDIESWLRKLTPKTKLIKERLLTKLFWGIAFLIGGICFGIMGLWFWIMNIGSDFQPVAAFIFGAPALALGIALLISYRVGKKLLAKEIEAEERESEAKES